MTYRSREGRIMSSRQSRISKFFALFATVVLLSILSAPTAQPILAQDDISSLEKENNAPLTAGNPYTFTAPPEDIQGHLGYDKATGQSLPDPTTIRNPES